MITQPKRNNFFTFLFIVFIGSITACNYSKQGEKESENLVRGDVADKSVVNEHDGSFLIQCGSVSLKMLKLAEIARSKSTSDKIRALAGDVTETHKALYDESSNLALHKNISMPAVISESDKLELDNFSAGTNEAFDSKFCEILLREQNYILETSQRFVDDAGDDDIRAFARIYSGKIDELNERALAVSKAKSI